MFERIADYYHLSWWKAREARQWQLQIARRRWPSSSWSAGGVWSSSSVGCETAADTRRRPAEHHVSLWPCDRGTVHTASSVRPTAPPAGLVTPCIVVEC